MGEPAIAASDRYALAVVAFELLTGEKPFQAEHFAAQARAQIEDDPPRVSELDPELSERVDDVIDRGMAKDPDDRWGTAEEFAERLGDSLTPPPPERTKAAAGAPGRPPHASSPRANEPRRRPREPSRPAAAAGAPRRSGPGTGTLLAALAAALLDLGIGFLLLQGDSNDKGNQTADRSTPTPAAKKKETPTPTAEKTAEPTPTRGDRDGDADAGTRRRPGQAQGQREPAPAAGLQPQQGRQVRRGAAGRPAGGPEGLQGQRVGQPLRLRAFELARAQRGTGDPERDQDARRAPEPLPRRPEGRGRRGAQKAQKDAGRSWELRRRRPRRRRRAVHVARAGTARL